MQRWIVGLSSGSSLNGIDAALVEVKGVGRGAELRLAHVAHLAFSREQRELLEKICANQLHSIRQTTLLHRLLGENFAAAARQVVDEAKVPWSQVLAAGCSGHTMWHEPDGRGPTTLALGMTAVVAEKTGLTVFSDFRSRDLILGGQGVFLSALLDQMMFGHATEERLLAHLGGMAAVLTLPSKSDERTPTGMQAGPCNILLDQLMRRMTKGRELFDAGGKHAVQGRCIDELLQVWLHHPAMPRRPGRHLQQADFGDAFIESALEQARVHQWSLHDVLCTATHFVARCVLNTIRHHQPRPPARILLSGGGVRNGFLWRILEQNLAPIPMDRTDTFGVACVARRAVHSAGLAALALDGLPANLPSATGASGSRLLGSITPGQPSNWARCLEWMTSQQNRHRLAA